MLEAVASQDTWFWHAFFGPPGSNNDLNVLDRSYVFSNILDGSAPKCPFIVNGVEYKLGYYLGDGIYPSWATIVKSFQHPPENDLKRCRFKRAQEAARKDVERAFGVLKGRWNILHRPAKQMHPRKHIEDPPSDEQPEEDILYQLRSRTTHENLRADLIEHLEHLSQQYHANNPNN
ncbi:hypothetical protein E3N88_19671 [Mikania micrantha]|uniref:DDE Tnp4 domain-containing protein n=1 Tax=Mikania micrantha TaxID=192012 RepID=A0A5N6NRA9_9ASTR|nr:hypothetical protein E3N88_19671 [Mikania micrantha]